MIKTSHYNILKKHKIKKSIFQYLVGIFSKKDENFTFKI